MTDDPITSWNDRISGLRKRGRVPDAALAVVPAGDVDVRRGRPPAPERLSEQERELWDRLTHSRRPGWFTGAEELLKTYVTTVMQTQQLEAALRKTTPDTSDDYEKLARLHRQTAALATTLAVKSRLTPSARIDKRLPPDGDLPVAKLGVREAPCHRFRLPHVCCWRFWPVCLKQQPRGGRSRRRPRTFTVVRTSTQGHTTYARTFTGVRTSTQGRTTYARTFTGVRTEVRISTLRGATTAQEPHMLTLGQEIIAWIEAHCRVPEGALVGQPLVLMDWQRDAINRIYDNEAGTRRCNVSVARKNGKTCFAACLLL